MADKTHKVTFEVPDDSELTEEDIVILREKFKAHIIETLDDMGKGDIPVIDDITPINGPLENA